MGFGDLLRKIQKLLYKRYFNKKIKAISIGSIVRNHKLSIKEKNEVKDYWTPYRKINNLRWHNTYKAIYFKSDSYEFEKFIPEQIFYTEIEPKLNNMDLVKGYEDKNIYHKIFDENKMPRVILRNMNGAFFDHDYEKITSLEIKDLFEELNASYIVKPSLDTQKGKNVNKITIENGQMLFKGDKYDDISILQRIYRKDYLIQEEIKQHEVLSSIYKYSLNTIRIVTLRTNESIYCVSTVIRFGNEKRIVDNRGIACGINSEGVLNTYATRLNMEKEYQHPYTGAEFSGVRIPNFEKLKSFVMKMHNKLIYFDLVSWDIAIDENCEFKMIEFNLNQQEINFHQINNGPLFGEYTNSVLDEVYN